MAFYSEAVVWNCALFQVKWQPDAYIQSCLFRSYHKWNNSENKVFFLLFVQSKLRIKGDFTIKKEKKIPSSRIRTSDLRMTTLTSTVLRSTNWAIEGIDVWRSIISRQNLIWLYLIWLDSNNFIHKLVTLPILRHGIISLNYYLLSF